MTLTPATVNKLTEHNDCQGNDYGETVMRTWLLWSCLALVALVISVLAAVFCIDFDAYRRGLR